MRPAPLIDTLTALRALPDALLRSLPPPMRRARRLGQRAGVAARRAAWYSALAALALLTPPGRAQAQASAAPQAGNTTSPSPAPSSAPAAPACAAALLVLAALGAQMAQRGERHPFTA